MPVFVTSGPIVAAIAEVLTRARRAASPGAVATYIPELAVADPEQLGVAVTSVLGHCYEAGDAAAEFTIQSISKPFVYALAIEELGLVEVRKHVGVEPSGQPFNAISFDDAGRPANPMINVGAITATSLIPAESAAERFKRIRDALSAFAGRPLELDERVYASEASTGDRNVALAGLARANGVLAGRVEDAVDPYFRQCALRVTADDLSVMAATLAGGGVNPVTGRRVVDADAARQTLSVMASCGMYDRSGDWILEVGLPAKSGVGGGIVAVSPGRFGIGVFSPPLDEVGNSALGVAVLKVVAHEFGLHLFNRPVTSISPVESIETGDDATVTLKLRGALDFVAAERIVHEAVAVLASRKPRMLALDLGSVTDADTSAVRLLSAVAEEAKERGITIVFADPLDVLGY